MLDSTRNDCTKSTTNDYYKINFNLTKTWGLNSQEILTILKQACSPLVKQYRLYLITWSWDNWTRRLEAFTTCEGKDNMGGISHCIHIKSNISNVHIVDKLIVRNIFV